MLRILIPNTTVFLICFLQNYSYNNFKVTLSILQLTIRLMNAVHDFFIFIYACVSLNYTPPGIDS